MRLLPVSTVFCWALPSFMECDGSLLFFFTGIREVTSTPIVDLVVHNVSVEDPRHLRPRSWPSRVEFRAVALDSDCACLHLHRRGETKATEPSQGRPANYRRSTPTAHLVAVVNYEPQLSAVLVYRCALVFIPILGGISKFELGRHFFFSMHDFYC